MIIFITLICTLVTSLVWMSFSETNERIDIEKSFCISHKGTYSNGGCYLKQGDYYVFKDIKVIKGEVCFLK